MTYNLQSVHLYMVNFHFGTGRPLKNRLTVYYPDKITNVADWYH